MVGGSANQREGTRFWWFSTVPTTPSPAKEESCRRVLKWFPTTHFSKIKVFLVAHSKQNLFTRNKTLRWTSPKISKYQEPLLFVHSKQALSLTAHREERVFPTPKMPPKDKSKAEKRVEDATFGMKNKSKSKKVQAYVKSVASSVQASMDAKSRVGKTPEQLELEKMKKCVGACVCARTRCCTPQRVFPN